VDQSALSASEAVERYKDLGAVRGQSKPATKGRN
jgi:hypothetical protein